MAGTSFKFSNLEKKEMRHEIVNLDASKSCQDTDVLTKIIKENADIFADFIHPEINAPFYFKARGCDTCF